MDELTWQIPLRTERHTSLPSEIAAALVARIRSGEVPVGARLPSEPAIARGLNVSRNSVREAMSVLREQGLVQTRQGLGTFVLGGSSEAAFPVNIGIEHLMSTTELITRAGHKPGGRDFSLCTGPGDPVALQRLSLPPEASLHLVERVRTADDSPVVLCRDHLSSELVPPRRMGQYRGDGSLFEFLRLECGVHVSTARADIVPTLPSTRVAELLEVSRRRPILLLRQVHYTDDNAAFLYSENFFNSDFMGLHVRRTSVT